MTRKPGLGKFRGLVRDLPLIVSLCAMGLLAAGLVPALGFATWVPAFLTNPIAP